jgi:small subunit ribosomal protein S6
MARDYDLGVVINPDVGDEQARAIVDRVTQTITANAGQVIRVNAWGRRRLAYPIEHHRDGLYVFFDIVMPPASVAEVERNIHVNEDIIRHLLILRDPRAIQQQRLREAEADARAAEARAQAAAAQAAAEEEAANQVVAAEEGAPAEEGAAEAAIAEAPADTAESEATEVPIKAEARAGERDEEGTDEE